MHFDDRRRLGALWEKRLARYGLAESQIRRANVQELGKAASMGAVAFDPEWQPRNMWKNPAQRRGYTMHDFRNMRVVRTRYAAREIPDWSRNDESIRALLLARYPKLATPGTRDRRDAGRAVFLLYFAYRLLWSDEQIAAQMGITRASVVYLLWLMKKRADRVLGGDWEIAGRNRDGRPRFVQVKRAGAKCSISHLRDNVPAGQFHNPRARARAAQAFQNSLRKPALNQLAAARVCRPALRAGKP
jgi:hypothetical protein